jgi:uncharacterized protein YodC (DUF2158 family)
MEEINVGDIVELKSGSPRMTVSEIIGQTAICRWFSGDKSEADTFPLAALKKVKNTEEKS